MIQLAAPATGKAAKQEIVMLVTVDGVSWHEPPYTEEEEDELYRRVNAGPLRILHAPKPQPVPAPLPEKQEK